MPVQNLSYHKTTYQILQYDSTKKQYTWYQNEMSSHRDNTLILTILFNNDTNQIFKSVSFVVFLEEQGRFYTRFL